MKYLSLTILSFLCVVSIASADPVTLSWDAHPGPIAGFKVYQSVVPGVYGDPTATIQSSTATSHSFDVPQTQLATTYYFTITAFKPSGVESVKSNEVSKTIPAIPIVSVTPKPGTPVLSIAKMTQTGAEVSWAPVDDGTGSPAKIDVRIGPSTATWGSMVSQVCPVSPCTITGLTPGTAYRLVALAWRPDPVKNVFGPFSEPVPFSTLPPDVEPPPPPPAGLKVTKATPEEVIVSALVKDCPNVRTSTKGSTSVVTVRSWKCAQ